MTLAIVAKTPAPRKPAKAPAPKGASKAAKAKSTRQAWSAGSIGLVAATITGLSLAHLAHGVQVVTGDSPYAAWPFAVGIDLGMIGAEVAMLTNPGSKAISKWANPFVWGTLAASAMMNAFAFAEHATSTPMMAAAIAMGLAIPAAIYCLMRIGAAQYLGSK